MKYPDFLHVDITSDKLKIDQKTWGEGRHGQKWVWPILSRDSKIDCVSRMNRWGEPIFCMLVQIQES